MFSIQYPRSAFDLLSKKQYAQRAWVCGIFCRQRASRRVSWHDHTSVLWQNIARFMTKRNTFCIKTPSILIQNAFRFHTKRPPFWYKMQLYKYVAVLRCSHSCPPTFQCWCPTATQPYMVCNALLVKIVDDRIYCRCFIWQQCYNNLWNDKQILDKIKS